MTRKDVRKLASIGLIGFWAVLCFNPVVVLAADADIIGEGETVSSITVSLDPEYNPDYTDLLVETGGTVKTATVVHGGTLTIDGGTLTTNAQGTQNRILSEGTLSVENSGTAEDVYIGMSDGGPASATVKSGGSIENVTVREWGSLNIQDGGYATNVSATSSTGEYDVATVDVRGTDSLLETINLSGNAKLSVSEGGKVTDITASSSDALGLTPEILVYDSGSLIDNVTLNGSKLTVEDEGKATNITAEGSDQDHKAIIEVNNTGSYTVDGVTMNNHSSLSINNAGVKNVIASGSDTLIELNTGGLNNVTMDGGTINISDGSEVNNVEISNGILSLTNTTANQLTVTNSDLSVYNSSSVSDSTLDGATATISQSTMTDTTVLGETEITVDDATLSNTTVESGANLKLTGENRYEIENITVNGGGRVESTGSITIGGDDGLVVEDLGQYKLSTNDTIANFEVEGQTGSIMNNTATGILVNNGSEFTVQDGDTGVDITVDDGGKLSLFGIASNITGNEGSNIIMNNADVTGIVIKGDASAKSASLENVTINNGTLNLNDSALAKSVYVSNNGKLNVNSGSELDKVDDATYNTVENSTLFVDGGTANGVILLNATASVESGGDLSDTIIQGDTTVNVTVADGFFMDSTVQSGATLTLNGGTESDIDNITVEGGGMIKSDSTVSMGSLTVEDGGKYELSTKDYVQNFEIQSNTLGDYTGSIIDGKADNLLVNDGSVLDVNGGEASNINVVAGGILNIYNSGKGTNIEAQGESDTNMAVINMSQNSSQASLYESTLNSYSELNVGPNSYVEDITVNENATINLDAVNSSIKTATVNSGTINAQSGSLQDVTLNSAGLLNIGSQAQASQVTATGGSTIAVDGGKLTGDIGGNIITDSSLVLTNDARAGSITAENATISASSTSSISDLVVKGNTSLELANGSATGVNINNGGVLTLTNPSDSATLYNTAIEDGGKLVSAEGGIDYYSLTINKNASYNFSTNDNIRGITQYYATGQKINDISFDNNKASKLWVNNGSVLTIKGDGIGENLTVGNGGNLIVETSTAEGKGVVNSVVLENGGNLTTAAGSLVNNLTALDGSNVNLADDTLGGNLIVYKNANGFDSNKLFVQDTKLTDLLLTGGQNSGFADMVNNDTANTHNLLLDNGEYNPAQLKGWKDISLVNSKLKTSGDIELASGRLIVDANSSLDVFGNTAIKQGELINAGTVDLTKNNYAGNTLTIDGDYTGVAARLNLDINVASGISDKIIIKGKALGETSVYLTSTYKGETQRNPILFAEAQNQGDTPGEGVFNIWRQEGSSYVWDTVYKNNQWLAQLKRSSLDNGKVAIVPEVAAYYGLIDNTFMQTSSLGASLRNNIAISEYKKAPCRNTVKGSYYKICRYNRPVFSGWLAPATTSISVESPYVYDAEINGFDGGLDLISNGQTKLGLLASYRTGKYNYEENGDEYEIDGTAETIIDSYLAGAYLRHDGRYWSTILAGYAGMLDADISTNDGVNTSSSGTVYGATLDVNYIYKNINGLRIEPGVRISYTAVDMDAVEDNAGKTQEFDNASRTEIEAGIRFAKRWELPMSRAEAFITPSVVLLKNNSSEFALDDEYSLSEADDKTLLKVSAGLSFDVSARLSAALTGSYITGDDYTNTSGNLSVMYKF